MNRVWVRDAGSFVTIIESFSSLTWTRRLYSMGSMRMTVNRQVDGAQFLVGSIGKEISLVDTPGATTPDFTYVVETLVFRMGETPENDIVELFATEAGLFHMRVGLPPPHDLPLSGVDSHHELTGDLESAMRELVDNNCGPSAAAERQYPRLVLDTNQNRGSTKGRLVRFQILADTLQQWCKSEKDMGWEVRYDAAADQHVFTVLQGADKSASVQFSLELDNVESQKWTESGADQANVAYIAGQGTGTGRAMAETWDGTEPSGKDRREIFVDARDLASSADLAPRGDDKLAERALDETFDVDIDPDTTFTYRTDWDLGDVVTFKNSKWGITKTARITEVQATLNADKSRVDRRLTVGKPLKTIKDRVFDAIGDQATARQ